MKFIMIHGTPKIMLKSFILTVLALPFFGCRLNSYGLNEFLYRPSGVKERTKKIEKLTGTDVPPVTPGVFTVLVITDVHFGAEKLPKNGPRFDDDFFDWLGNFIRRIRHKNLHFVSVSEIWQNTAGKKNLNDMRSLQVILKKSTT